MALTRVVLPAFWRPTIAIYNSLLKNFDFIQSINLLKRENIVFYIYLLLFMRIEHKHHNTDR